MGTYFAGFLRVYSRLEIQETRFGRSQTGLSQSAASILASLLSSPGQSLNKPPDDGKILS